VPRGNPNFGRQVKSPGRPPARPKDTTIPGRQAEVDEFIGKHLMEYVKVQHEIALDKNKAPTVRLAASETLITRLLGKERVETGESALVGLVRELIGLAPKPRVVEGQFQVLEPKELAAGQPE
jgi:hypothetical protein